MIILGDSNSFFIKLDGFDNLAEPGYRVSDVLSQLDDIQPGDTLIIGVGVNDAATIRDLNSDGVIKPDIEEFKNDYSALLDLAKDKFEEIVVLGLVSSDEQATILDNAKITYSNKTIGEFNDCIKELCKSAGVKFVDLLPYFFGNEKELLVDHIHPNIEGQDIILRELGSLL